MQSMQQAADSIQPAAASRSTSSIPASVCGGSDRGGDTDEGGVFEEHISSSRKLAISGTSATVAHSEGKEITVIYRNRGKLWTVP